MSSALIWQLVKDHNSFLHKRERTSRLGAVQFTNEPGNLLGANSYKYSGLAHATSVAVNSDLTLRLKDSKNSNKPKSAISSEKLNLHAKKSGAKVVAAVNNYRADLTTAAQAKYTRVARASVKGKGVKSTRRHKL